MALEDKFDDIKKLIDTGKEKGYLTYDQVNDLIPHDVHSPEDLDDLLTTIGTQGIDVLEGPKLPSATLDKKFEDNEEGEDVELDLTPGALEKTNDPVRMYLREMGTVPISRKYMRTGSLVFSRAPGVRSSSTSSPSSPSSNFLSSAAEGSLGPSSTSIPCVPIVVSRSSKSSGLTTSCGMSSLTWS